MGVKTGQMPTPCKSLLVVLSVRRTRRRVALRLQCEKTNEHDGFHKSGAQEWTDGDRVVEWEEMQ